MVTPGPVTSGLVRFWKVPEVGPRRLKLARLSPVPGPPASLVDAATVITQGPRWATLPTGLGMEALVLPAEAETTIPALTKSRNLRSLSVQGLFPPEMEKFIASTSPCNSTLFMPAVMLAAGQLLVGQTLYMRILAQGAIP